METHDQTERRTYRQKRRAQQQYDTRQRIVEAAVSLHEAVGDEEATITAIAEKAGVGRVTVYRHFPDERALLTACTDHYLALHPPPDPSAWPQIEAPGERLQTAISEIYTYHRRTEKMIARGAADSLANPVLAELLQPVTGYWHSVRDLLAGSLAGEHAPSPSFAALVGHLISFGAWQSLTRDQGLEDAEAVALSTRLIAGMIENNR